jgi:uncharacterized protein YbaR (Trm112 family)
MDIDNPIKNDLLNRRCPNCKGTLNIVSSTQASARSVAEFCPGPDGFTINLLSLAFWLGEKPVGVCTHNCLDKDYSTGHTLCMKNLPCPDHKEVIRE